MFDNSNKIILNYFFKNPLLSVVFLAVSLRLFLFTLFYSSVTIYPDSDGYLELAKIISSFNLIGYNGLRSPGYPLIISLLFRNLYLIVFFQFALGIISSLFWYKSLLNFGFSIRRAFL